MQGAFSAIAERFVTQCGHCQCQVCIRCCAYTSDWQRPINFYPHNAMLARVLAVALCLCLPVGVLSKRLNESVWFLAWELRSTYSTLCCTEIQVPSKIGVLPSGTLLQTPDLENLITAYRSSKRVVNLAREWWTLRAWWTGPSSVNWDDARPL